MTEAPQKSAPRIWIPTLIMCVVLPLVAVIATSDFFAPATFETARNHVTVQSGGEAGVVTFIILDANQQPVRDVWVSTQSDSGWDGSSPTDADGQATLRPGEHEVTAIMIDDDILDFAGTQFSCHSGLFRSRGLLVSVSRR